MIESKPFVIAVAAVSGGGKTSAVTQLVKALPNSKALYFDEYDFEGPDDIIDWVDHGPDYDIWNLDPLIRDIEVLLSESLTYIVLDFPFAYKHTKTKKYIDLAIFIDTPLDMALARRIMRDYTTSAVENILVDLDHYVSNGRRGYIEMLHTIKPNSDFIIDGTMTVPEMIKTILAYMGKRTSHE